MGGMYAGGPLRGQAGSGAGAETRYLVLVEVRCGAWVAPATRGRTAEQIVVQR